MRVLVTGATGLIGSQVLYQLHQIGNPRIEVLSPNRLELNLLSPDSCRKYFEKFRPETLVHSAWHTVHGSFWMAPENCVWRETGVEMAKFFLANGGKRMIVLGTCVEYEWSASCEKNICYENTGQISGKQNIATPLNPSSVYGKQKNLYHQQLKEIFSEVSGSSLLWGRVFFTFGYKEKKARLIPSIIRALVTNKALKLSCGLQKRDFLFATDLGDLIARLCFISQKSPIDEVNLCSGQANSLRDIGRLLTEISGKSGDCLQFSSEPLTESEWVVGSVEHRRQLIDWEPSHTLVEGLKKTWDWWLDDGRILNWG